MNLLIEHHSLVSSPIINEPGFIRERVARAVEFYQQQKYAFPVFHLCNDATALRRGVRWRAKDNALIGLNTLDDIRCPDTLEALDELVKHYGFASEVDILVLAPLDPSIPPYLLALFPQQHLSTADVYLQRWAIAARELERYGAYIISHGVDGAAPHLCAEKSRQPNGCIPLSARAVTPIPELVPIHAAMRDKQLFLDVPSLEGPPLRISASGRMISLTLDGVIHDILLPDLHFQDFSHVGAKLRVRLCGRNGHGVTLGSGRAVISLLKDKIASATWRQLMVNVHLDDFDPRRDPMNLPAFFRLTSDQVLGFLRVQAEDDPPTPRALITNAEELSPGQLRYVLVVFVVFAYLTRH